MTSGDVVRVRASVRTMAFALTGVTLAAFLTTTAAIGLDGEQVTRDIAMMGSSIAILLVALLSLVCALRLPDPALRRRWLFVALGVSFTAAGSVLRAATLYLRGDSATNLALAEGVYAVGAVTLLVMGVVLVRQFRSDIDLMWPAIESSVVVALIAVVAWVGWGSGLRLPTDAAPAGGAIAVGWVAVFVLLGALRAQKVRWVAPEVLFGFGMLGIAFSMGVWVVLTALQAWAPGGLMDFSHLAGHVLILAAVSIALDGARARRAAAA